MSSWGSAAIGSGTIVSAYRASVGMAKASVGTTVFNGDQLGTDSSGTLQVRAAAARLLLSSSSHVIWGAVGDNEGSPTVTLTGGSATFSTANGKALVLRASTAVFRPESDQPTIGNVTLLNPKELLVRCWRGALTIAVDDDVRVISEGTAYHVVLDANAPPPAEFPQWDRQKQPRKAGKSKFIVYAIALTAAVTIYAVSEALESPDHP